MNDSICSFSKHGQLVSKMLILILDLYEPSLHIFDSSHISDASQYFFRGFSNPNPIFRLDLKLSVLKG